MREGNGVLGADLRDERNAPDFLDIRVVRRGHAVHVPNNLRSEVSDADELLEDILGYDVGEA